MKSNEAERQLRDMRGGDDSERCGGGGDGGNQTDGERWSGLRSVR